VSARGRSNQVDPLSPHAVGKLAGEMYLQAYVEMYCLAPICLALANVYGPRQSAHGAAGVIAVLGSAMVTGGPLLYTGTVPAHDYAYVGAQTRTSSTCQYAGVLSAIPSVAGPRGICHETLPPQRIPVRVQRVRSRPYTSTDGREGCGCGLFDGDRLGQVAGFIDVVALGLGQRGREYLQWNRRKQRLEKH
jgi:NAD-dependent epimerase/dehydratase family protein